jgi:hypothetical protein
MFVASLRLVGGPDQDTSSTIYLHYPLGEMVALMGPRYVCIDT